MKATLAYKYRVMPNAAQRRALEEAAWRARRVWKALVAVQRWAERECRNGRKASLVRRYRELLAKKQLVGRAVAEARKRMSTAGLTLEDAVSQHRDTIAARDSAMIKRRDGIVARRASIRNFAVCYAIEAVSAYRAKFGGEALAFWAVIQKFRDATKLYSKGLRARPRFKSRWDSVTLQFQVQDSTRNPIAGEAVDLSKLAGDACRHVPMVFHRPLPPTAKIKQVAFVRTATRMAVAFMLEAEAGEVSKSFEPRPGRVCGMDPGRKVALTWSDRNGAEQGIIQPPLFRDRRFEKRLRREMRRLHRQRRKNNPEAFNADDTPKRGVRPTTVSNNMRKTLRRIAAMHSRLADTRLESYRLSAREMLGRFDVVGVGTWRGRGSAPGEGKARRAQLRRDYDHAISTFNAILHDFAKRSTAPKQVVDVPEAFSTRTCPGCGELTGPKGLTDLGKREWTCPQCGGTWKRDFAAAMTIARRAAQSAAGTQPACARKARTKAGGGSASQSPRETGRECHEAPASQVGAVASAAVMVQTPGGARAPEVSVGEGAARPASLDAAIHRPPGGHRSHSGADGPITHGLTGPLSQ